MLSEEKATKDKT